MVTWKLFGEDIFQKASCRLDRIELENLFAMLSNAEAEEDEGKQEEFRQLLKSYMRFAFVAQVMRLGDTAAAFLLCVFVDGTSAQPPSARRK